MPNLGLKSILIFSLLMLGNSLDAQILWRNTHSGMSPKELKQSVKGLIFPGNPQTWGNGTIEMFDLEKVIISNYIFTARFLFKQQKLEQVTLELNEKPSWGETMNIYDELFQTLKYKYGNPVFHELSGPPYYRKELTWLSGKTNVTLYASTVDINETLL